MQDGRVRERKGGMQDGRVRERMGGMQDGRVRVKQCSVYKQQTIVADGQCFIGTETGPTSSHSVAASHQGSQ